MKNVIVIGAGGHGRVIADIIRCSGDVVLGFLDDHTAVGSRIDGIPVLGSVEKHGNYPEAWFVIGIGNARVRQAIAQRLGDKKWYTAIHPNAVIAQTARLIGEGTVVMAGTVINPGAGVGKHSIVNTGAILDHDTTVGDYCHIAVGAKLAGTVTIGNGTWIGIGASVSNNISVCGDCMIGAGAVVVRSIEEPGTYVGVPARKIK